MLSHSRHNKKGFAVVLALAAILPAAASAQPNRNQTAGASQPIAVRVVRVTSPAGFDWGDAGIGAASGVGLAILVLGGSHGVAERRSRSTAASSAATN